MKNKQREALLIWLLSTYSCVLFSRTQAGEALSCSLSWLDERKEKGLSPRYIKGGDKNTKVQYLVCDIVDYLLDSETSKDDMFDELHRLVLMLHSRLILSRKSAALVLGISTSELDVRQKRDDSLVCIKDGVANARVSYEVTSLVTYIISHRIRTV